MRLPRLLPTLPPARHVLAVAALVAHVLAATGAPVPSPRSIKASRSSVPYPCSDHPCGCLTSEQCWAGDCCCFSLEQKLAWADARGIDAPAQARSAAEARKASQPAKPKPKPKRPCCRGEDEAVPASANCDRTAEPPATNDADSSIRWVVAVFTQKCRGEGPAGLLKLDPTAPPPPATESATAEPHEFITPPTPSVVFTSHVPPARPPRRL